MTTFETTALTPSVPAGAEVHRVRVAPDGARIAFARRDPEGAGIWVGAPGQAGVQLIAADGWVPDDLAWSPDGEHVAYLVGGGPPPSGARAVGWTRAATPGELGRVDGSSFAWTRQGGGLLVADLREKKLVRHSTSSGKPQELAAIDDDGDPHFPVRIAPSPDGSKVAFTCRRTGEGISEVWIVARDGDRPTTTLLTQIPGAFAHVLPFWSPKGMTVAMLIVHVEQQKSAIVAVPRLEGEGVILYENDLIDGVETPAWSPSGKDIALLRTPAPAHEFTKSGPQQLTLLRVEGKDQGRAALSTPGAVLGEPRFLDERRLAIEGIGAAWIVDLGDPT